MNRKTIASLLLPLSLTVGVSISLAQANAQPKVPVPAQKQNEAPDDKQTDTLTPLAIGNTWVYETKDDQIITTDRIEGMVLFDNHPWYLLRTYERPIDQPNAEAELATDLWVSYLDGADADAFVEIDQDTLSLKLTEISRHLRYPVAQGLTYKPNPEDPGLKIEVLAIDEAIKTPAGEFTCVVYRETFADEPGYSFTAYVAPGVGIVRYTTEQDGESSTTDLIKYTLIEQ